MHLRGTILYGPVASNDVPKASLNCLKHPAVIIQVRITAMGEFHNGLLIVFKMRFETKTIFSFYGYIKICFLCSNSRRSLFLLKLGSFQFAVLKIIFTILSIVLYTNGNFDLSDVSWKYWVTLPMPLYP